VRCSVVASKKWSRLPPGENKGRMAGKSDLSVFLFNAIPASADTLPFQWGKCRHFKSKTINTVRIKLWSCQWSEQNPPTTGRTARGKEQKNLLPGLPPAYGKRKTLKPEPSGLSRGVRKNEGESVGDAQKTPLTGHSLQHYAGDY